ncbi:MAG: hypothetical protein M1817_002178 [Caeruleum heppii]|nr:MAG: hypothetical protein M1817_002178 [Caeruleum heppii]
MTVTEICYFPVSPTTTIDDISSPAGQIWLDLLDTVRGEWACRKLHWGRQAEDKEMVVLMIEWVTLATFKQFRISTGYESFYESMSEDFNSVFDDPTTVIHVPLTPSISLTAQPTTTAGTPQPDPFTAPIIELVTFYFPRSISPSAQKDFSALFQSFVAILRDENVPGSHGEVSGWVEDGIHYEGQEEEKERAFVAVLGWDSIEAHMRFRDTEAFKRGIKGLREASERVTMVHVEFEEQ